MSRYVDHAIFDNLRAVMAEAELNELEQLIQYSSTLRQMLDAYAQAYDSGGGSFEQIALGISGNGSEFHDHYAQSGQSGFIRLDPDRLATVQGLVATLSHELGHFSDRVRLSNSVTVGFQMRDAE
ncbi:MAG: hypothetical protein ACTS6J_11930, partial [Burkholderiales bacterium]